MKFERVAYSLIILLFLAVTVEAQERPRFFKKWSVAVNYGASHLLAPKDGMNLSNHLSHNFLKGELRYMFNPIIGVAGNYAHTSLVRVYHNHPVYDDSPSYRVHRGGLEAVVHLSNLINFDSDGLYQYFNILLHTGVGYSRSNRKDQMATIMVGLSPQLKLSEQLALKLDATYNANLKQHSGYDGQELSAKRTGQIMNYSIGLQWYFDFRKKGKVSADW